MGLKERTSGEALPPAETLARYGRALPVSADRILSIAERDAAHRRALEARVVVERRGAAPPISGGRQFTSWP